MTDIIVLGGGWAGTVFALELKRNFRDADVIVLEKSNAPGGLLRSIIINNHVFDTGGSHVIFSRNRDVLNRMLFMLKSDFIKHFRKTYILLNSMFVPYPFENGLQILPPDERADAVISFLEAWFSRDKDLMPKTLKDWIYGFFGKWISEKYLIPYNKKIWKRPLDKISADWIFIPGRLPIPNWKDVVRSAIGVPTVGYHEQYVFYYPRHGGIQALFNSAFKESKKLGVKFVNNVHVSSIKYKNGEWIVNYRFRGKKLVNTIPIKDLVKALNAPEYIIKASERLDYNRIIVVGLALNKLAQEQHWIYVPSSDIIFHRYAWISNYSPENAPNARSTIITETTLPPEKKVDIEKILDRVIEDLEKIGILKQEEILFAKAWLHEYGYPVYSLGHNKNREIIMTWLHEKNIISTGRWGSWHYWNMDKIYEEILKNFTTKRLSVLL